MTRWPVTLRSGEVTLRPLHRSDAADYAEVRAANAEWVRPWEATYPGGETVVTDFRAVRAALAKLGRRGAGLPFAIVVNGRFRGQLTVSNIQWGSMSGATLGYWIDRRVAGRGHTPRAVAMATDYCFFTLGLHRMEINIRPENTASLRVVEKLGFRYEGRRKGYMHINGAWADHDSFALVSDEVPAGLLARVKHAIQN